ncbi:MAG: hypothetical protein A3B99_05410 [Candidatus Yanofskybacteria bacterium RIFCSPHIGHO2_02_FULL_44_12b]|uniref:BioF2-like acetyltransferase domain-containing protein n=2 Tax=Candidatus Yanofskyibacteriota TaxID=1752733 RepID=A0A1F8GL72_9BACT|nr:MAG: Protein FemA [Candidatus Yanofskybacteria bacterium GW2011_GWA2_44_9]OGN05144.1 MAG: hypothetical protein A2659_02300 [Candidatus Yanofskybacteria bacterium RIFCSPHIGHO2_01_FULL_44_24]OGN14579.1 MAG: hypothetical protein A3B99_05410 [Candidatus Yanofskybacteria bacterium RIFCSPHIGHO2_02_FULL_44_12b]OGN25478.1 MAG: hypothetical protein A2925_01975 [Candidatus Yanofskybacteria bacterium RIFCSPLOWO2_01_FULL_44_22]
MTLKSFLQTKEWLDFQTRIGRKTWRFDNGKIQANIIRHDLPFGKNYLYIPHGPVLSFDDIRGGLQGQLVSFLAYIKDLGRINKSILVKVEPFSDIVMELIYRRGFRRSVKRIQPNRTVVLDLALSEEELLSQMHQKTRYNIGLASKKGIIFKDERNLDVFWDLLKQTAKKDNFNTHSKDYYKKFLEFFSVEEGRSKDVNAKMFLMYFETKPIAGAIVMTYGGTAYYLHGAMDRNYASLMAPYLMHWEIMKWAKSQKFLNYDLWGVDAKKWPGVTRFKLGWLGSLKHGQSGGKIVEYPGSFDLPVSRFWYFMYNLTRKIL